MTNKEFYGDKLLAIALEVKCRALYKTVYGEGCEAMGKCGDCEFCNVESIENWLNTEHVEQEPPLLENGDNLKPGDWIMVRNNDYGWEKLRFVCYHNNIFWTLYDNEDWFHIGSEIMPWAQARLPMEDE